jgi:hypothetical protein
VTLFGPTSLQSAIAPINRQKATILPSAAPAYWLKAAIHFVII